MTRPDDDPSAVSACALSAVVATTQPWPEVRRCLDALHAQIERVGGEIVLGDGSRDGIPAPYAARYPHLRPFHRPGASVFDLRADAVERARGDIVAITEDHCVVAPDWCERILVAHRDHPDAAAIGGAVENGATATQIDWASFFIVNGAWMAPLRSRARRTITLQANVSYKRRVLPTHRNGLGQMEWIMNRDLRRAGRTLVTAGEIRVEHLQSLGVGGTCQVHYDDARTIAAFRSAHMGGAERWCRIAACALMPLLVVARTLAHVLPKRRWTAALIASLPWMVVLATCRAWGSLLGFLFGPGESPQRIR